VTAFSLLSTEIIEGSFMAQDPVCLMDVNPRKAAAVSDHLGHAYYFCSQSCQSQFDKQPEIYTRKGEGLRLTVGVMGSADAEQSEATLIKSYTLGQVIAEKGYALITGACPGLPYECARGARSKGGFSIGISPASSLDEHAHRYHSPSDVYDALIYSGNGLMGREVINIHSSDIVVILGGQSGTLGEFAIAYDEGKLIGVLEGIDGISESIPSLVSGFRKQTGAKLFYDQDPTNLITDLSRYYVDRHYKRPSCFCDQYHSME